MQVERIREIPIECKYQYFASESGKIYRWTGSEMLEIVGWTERSRYDNQKYYQRVALIFRSGPKKYYVQRLVLMAFAGIPENDEIARHKSADSLDNAVTNLKWGTHLENNTHDRKRDGTYDRRGYISEKKAKKLNGHRVPEESDCPF